MADRQFRTLRRKPNASDVDAAAQQKLLKRDVLAEPEPSKRERPKPPKPKE